MKVSVIMQSYLGDYPGSRSNSDIKFIRAVNSFINQTDRDSELIIISDGCMITHNLYYEHFKTNDRIKYVYVDKDSLNMYEENGKKFYRGFPREVGRCLVSGELTTYMDSDDIILPNHISTIKQHWLIKEDSDWLINLSWYENVEMLNKRTEDYNDIIKGLKTSEIKVIDGLPSEWIPYQSYFDEKVIKVPLQPTVLTHKSNVTTKWVDTYEDSEDIIFNKNLRSNHIKGNFYNYPTYVRCHYPNRWDY